MSTSRLSTALDDGLITLQGGNIAVMRPTASYDLSSLPREAVQVVHGSYPDYTAFAQAGYAVSQDMPACRTAIVVVPRSKALARAMVAAACAVAELVIVDGQKTDGVDSLYKSCRKVLGDVPSLTKGHGRIFWFPASDVFADWKAVQPVQGDHGFYTQAGVYADGKIDKGSALLADALPAKLPARMADLGAGWGYLSAAVLARDGVTSLDLIEAEALSLECARLNVTDTRAQFQWADALQFKPDTGYDGIVMNPPFHASRAADPGLGRSFIQAAARLLGSHGKLWMVANRHLPYETTLSECFRNVDMIAGNGAFKVIHANRPNR